MSHVQAGLADFIILMTVIKKEIESLFDKKALRVSSVEAKFWPYEEGNYSDKFVEFTCLSAKLKRQVCSIELWANESNIG